MARDKCTKCKKSLKDGEARYNYPSGVLCMGCGENKNQKLEIVRKNHGLAYAIAMESTISA